MLLGKEPARSWGRLFVRRGPPFLTPFPGKPRSRVRFQPLFLRGFLFEKEMSKAFARKFYRSSAWRNVRGYVFIRDQMLCQDCLKRGVYTPAAEVHHIIELTPDNIHDEDITLNPDNLVSLCKACHYARHNPNARRYTVDEFGSVVPKR